jgi:hypothetical protein
MRPDRSQRPATPAPSLRWVASSAPGSARAALAPYAFALLAGFQAMAPVEAIGVVLEAVTAEERAELRPWSHWLRPFGDALVIVGRPHLIATILRRLRRDTYFAARLAFRRSEAPGWSWVVLAEGSGRVSRILFPTGSSEGRP